MTTLSLADSLYCEYEDNTKSIIESKITGVKNIQKEVYPYQDDARKCFVKFDAEIDGQWISTSASKVFDGDISENEACSSAKLKAKKLLLEKLGIEILQNTKHKKCAEITSMNRDITTHCRRYTKRVNVRGQMIQAWGTICKINGEWVKR